MNTSIRGEMGRFPLDERALAEAKDAARIIGVRAAIQVYLREVGFEVEIDAHEQRLVGPWVHVEKEATHA